jgi:hypothetical protein
MWKQLYDIVKTLLTLAEDLKSNRAEIKEIRQELKDLTFVVHGLAHEIKRLSEREAGEREKLILKIENQLMRSERGLPAADKDPE